MSEGPQRQIEPYKALSARRLNAAADDVYRANALSAGGPVELRRHGTGGASPFLQFGPPILVRVTGKNSLYPGFTAPGNVYSGELWFTTPDGGVHPVNGANKFYTDAWPLVEVAGRGDVPTDSYQWCDLAPQGDHLRFIAPPAGTGGMDPCNCPTSWSERWCCIPTTIYLVTCNCNTQGGGCDIGTMTLRWDPDARLWVNHGSAYHALPGLCSGPGPNCSIPPDDLCPKTTAQHVRGNGNPPQDSFTVVYKEGLKNPTIPPTYQDFSHGLLPPPAQSFFPDFCAQPFPDACCPPGGIPPQYDPRPRYRSVGPVSVACGGSGYTLAANIFW